MNKGTSLIRQFVEQERFDEYTTLQILCLNQNNEIAAMVLDCGCDVNEQGKYGWTALHISALTNCIDTAMLLLNSFADPLSKDTHGFLPVDLAHDLDVKELLITAMELKGETDLARMYRRVIEMKLLGERDSVDDSSDYGYKIQAAEQEGHLKVKNNSNFLNFVTTGRRSTNNNKVKRTLSIIPERSILTDSCNGHFKISDTTGSKRNSRLKVLSKNTNKIKVRDEQYSDFVFLIYSGICLQWESFWIWDQEFMTVC